MTDDPARSPQRQQAQARSLHPNWSVSVAFCDGSIRTVQASVPQYIWWAMLGLDDGIPFDSTAY